MSHEALSKLNFCYKNFGYNWFVNFFKKTIIKFIYLSKESIANTVF